jgi:hypothetical protein
VDDTPEPVTFRDVRSICANVASASQIGGYWSTPKGDERALVWTVNGHGPTGVELHPADWQKSVVLGCGDGQQIGMSIDFTPEDDNEAGIDYCLRLWLIVVKIDALPSRAVLE